MKKTFKTSDTVFTTWYSEWNANTYVRTVPFCEAPCAFNAGSTAGAPVLVSDNLLVGLIRECSEALFQWDGSVLTVEAPDSALFVSFATDEQECWAQYHEVLGLKFRDAPFGLLPEYCTWVEQNRIFHNDGLETVQDALTGTMIFNYLDTVRKAEWKLGRFTIDEGWCPRAGKGGFGDWVPREDLFMELLAEKIQSAGHIPGLWMAPALIDKESDAALRNPELIGSPVQMGGECDWSRYFYLNPGQASQELIFDLFQRAFSWGFRKFKLDIFYGPKPVMFELSKQCRIAADELPEPVELEGHIPDPFCAQYMDVIRLNDILISTQHPDWREVYQGHLYVCSRSAPGVVLNLDHIGGNCVNVDEGRFVEHVNLMKPYLTTGYPSLSILPQHIGEGAVQAVTSLLK